MTAPAAPARAFVSVLALLTATGWASNQFAAMLPVLERTENLTDPQLDAMFGIYALGLLPGLLSGGALSDRVGRPRVAVPGAVVAMVGTLTLLFFQDPAGLLIGRFIVGLGAGLTFSAGTAWAADLRGSSGTVLAGVFLTAGFGIGPLVSGIVAQTLPHPTVLPFALSAALSVIAVGAASTWAYDVTRGSSADESAFTTSYHSSWTALAWSLPVGLFVFGTVTVAVVTVPARLPGTDSGPFFVGCIAGLALGVGILAQALARNRAWGPRTGVAGAALAAVGFALAAVAVDEPSLALALACCVVMGAAYGLCLREGLLDVETFAPPQRRGRLTGTYYVVTYLGFGLPLIVDSLEDITGAAAPLIVLAVVGAVVAAGRALALRTTRHPRGD